MAKEANETPISRVLAGLLGRFRTERGIPKLRPDERIDGKTCLVTGANTGLGKAIAIHLARRGGRVIMACRSGVPHAAEDVRVQSGSAAVEILPVDLSDFATVHALCDRLRDEGRRIDILVLNAAVVPLKARPTAQGLDLMFGVNYASNVVLIRRLLADGVLRPGEKPRPRIVFVSSEDHRTAEPIDLTTFADFREYSSLGDLSQYGRTKLMLTTYAYELSR
ncbi:MAG: SDR family NAD(P)-dependent oxidoreductase, partial [Myxococcales bacterium]|nr:SDR family NAD(P)-dependent oxidoreductase [Myxococcales bacterium]